MKTVYEIVVFNDYKFIGIDKDRNVLFVYDLSINYLEYNQKYNNEIKEDTCSFHLNVLEAEEFEIYYHSEISYIKYGYDENSDKIYPLRKVKSNAPKEVIKEIKGLYYYDKVKKLSVELDGIIYNVSIYPEAYFEYSE